MPRVREKFKRFPIFVKNGTFSDKFDFANCTPQNNAASIAAAIAAINYNAHLLGAGGQSEVVIRERLGMHTWRECFRIYQGLPLRPEFRVFYDFDKKQVLYTVNYWDWDYCYPSISRDKTDKTVYEAAYPSLSAAYQNLLPEVERLCRERLSAVRDLDGIWSVDIMCLDGQYYLIDMAKAQQSAYWNPQKVGLSC